MLSLPHPRAREALASGAPVFLPVNPVEYHGPHLSLRNDAIVAAGLIGDIHRHIETQRPGAGWPLLVAEDLEIGVDPVPGPGTRATPYPVARRIVISACEALVALGAQRVVLMTFHGSPLHALALEVGREWLERAGVPAVVPFNALLRRIISKDLTEIAEILEHVPHPTDRDALAPELETDLHAGFVETSLALHYTPDSVDPGHVNLPPCPPVERIGLLDRAARVASRLGRPALAAELSLAAFGLGWHALRPFPGYTSRPHLASPRAGAALAGLISEGLAQVILDVLEGRAPSPAPLMPWLVPLTLGGLLAVP